MEMNHVISMNLLTFNKEKTFVVCKLVSIICHGICNTLKEACNYDSILIEIMIIKLDQKAEISQ